MTPSRAKRSPRASRLALGLALLPLLAQAQAPAPTPAPAPARPVTERAAPDPNAIRVLLVPQVETTLASQINGRIERVNVVLGASFNKGTTLLTFACDEQRARVRMADAELASARENHEAKIRLQGLQAAGELEVTLAAAAAAKARAQLDVYRAELAHCTVSGPFAGRVAKVHVKPHQGVTAGQPLLDVVSAGALKLRLNVPSKWLAWVKTGTQFQVDIDETGKSYPARVTAVNARVDAVSQTVELEALIDSKAAGDLLPGMSGIARFTPPA